MMEEDLKEFGTFPEDVREVLIQTGIEMMRTKGIHPGTQHRLGILVEEVGEVAKELLENGKNLVGECVQVASSALRLALEGDSDFKTLEDWREFAPWRNPPPSYCRFCKEMVENGITVCDDCVATVIDDNQIIHEHEDT